MTPLFLPNSLGLALAPEPPCPSHSRPPSLATGVPSWQPMSSCHRGSILDFINVPRCPGNGSAAGPVSLSLPAFQRKAAPTHTMWLSGEFSLTLAGPGFHQT